ncbi:MULTISPECIES: AAA family ATPase [unclassified Ruminococcus]|uniref:AAA family ATPase n=2 Tax=Bacillota TaxID=1239 RepID=UPI002FE6355D
MVTQNRRKDGCLMGIYLNPGNNKFKRAVNSDIYVDKTGLIKYTNSIVDTLQSCVCVSRPRRFGKSMAADMLTAYYSKGCDSRELFSGLEIAKDESFEEHLNKYDTIFLNMQEFLSRSSNVKELLERVEGKVIRELKKQYPDVELYDENDLAETMQDIFAESECPFIVIIDEWDCIFREFKHDKAAQEIYLDFLRDLLKDKEYIYLAYMTGILPIKKYGTHSALNMFDEFSMIDPGPLAEYVGFTEKEVEALCQKYQMDINEIKNWYDGYSFEEVESVYSPKSVVSCMRLGKLGNYWNQTETFEALQIYIDMNFEGLRDDILSMIAGETVPVNTRSFTNDMTTFRTEDDVLTLLIHLGYLGYRYADKTVFIPNEEIRSEYVSAIAVSDWGEVSKALKNSADTLQAIWQGREEQVAEGIRQAHFETSHLQYNDENALSYTISLALYAARNFYTVHRELSGGKGFADIVYVPRKRFLDKPALVVELKWDKNAEGAIQQIKEKEYCRSLEEYKGNLLLVGINYDKKTQVHTCKIEQYRKEESI